MIHDFIVCRSGLFIKYGGDLSVRVAELVARDGTNPERLKQLDDMAGTAREAMKAIDTLEKTISNRPDTNGAELVESETEMLLATVRELEKVR